MSKKYNKLEDFRGNTLIVLTILVILCMISRILFMGRHLEGWDSVDFALGLHDYDIAYYQPHFPGYPVYMFFCWLVHLFTENDTLALIIPGAVFGSATLVPLFYLARRMFSSEVAWITAFIYTVNPLCWLQSEKAFSDATGLFFIILSAQLLFFALTSRLYALRFLISGSVILGICLGVRLSYFPFIILWLYVLHTLLKSKEGNTKIRYGLFAFIIGICIWLVPLVCYMGLKPLMTNGLYFIFGHFGDWGGSVVTSQNIFSRFSDFIWCVFCNGLGFWCYDTSAFRIVPSIIMGIGIVLHIRHAKFDDKTRFITFYMIPYFLWVFFCQNLEKPRHVLPLIPLIIICISAGLARLRESKFSCSNLNLSRHRIFSPFCLFIGVLIMSMSIISIGLVYAHKKEPIAQIQLLRYMDRNYDTPSTRIYCWETKRFFEYYAPLWDTRRVRNANDLQYDIESSLVTPEIILSTSKIDGISSIRKNPKVIAEFKNNRYINNPYHKLTLYDLSALK